MKFPSPALYKKLFIVYSIAIIAVNFLDVNPPDSAINDTYIIHFRLDHIIHFMMFFIWMLVVRFAYSPRFPKAILWIAGGIVFAIFSECLQYYIPFRSFNINDVLANVFGGMAGAFALLIKDKWGQSNEVTG